MLEKDKIIIIIPSYNGKEYFYGLMPLLNEEKYNDFSLDILVVDNNSTDGSVEFLKENYPSIKIIENKEMMGYFLIQRNYINDSTTLGWVPAKDDNYKEKRDFTGYLPNPILRLFQNKEDIQFKNKVHESVGESIYQQDGKVKNSNIPSKLPFIFKLNNLMLLPSISSLLFTM